MCVGCYPATQATTALTHATPVDVVSLAASLAAYDAVRPTIRHLQLCHRFGKGQNVSVHDWNEMARYGHAWSVALIIP